MSEIKGEKYENEFLVSKLKSLVKIKKTNSNTSITNEVEL